jgi:soluble lytic murein transglycosylase-like protein
MLCCVGFLPVGSHRPRHLSLALFDKIRLAAHSAKIRGLSIDAAHDCALSAGAERTGAARRRRRTAGGPNEDDRRAGRDRGSDRAAAKMHSLPEALVRLLIRRESNFNPRAVYRGNYGLIEIRLGTARALGYRGDAEGLLDPATNMTYGMSYLAGAYRAAHGDEARTLALYSRGYHNVH